MIGPQHRAAVRNETILSIAINALIPTAIIWALGVAPPDSLAGDYPLLPGMTMASGLATLVMSCVVTLLVRGRVRKSPALALAHADVPAVVGWLPDNLLLRAVAMAVVAVLLLVPIGSAAAMLFGVLPLGVGDLILFNLLFGALVGLTMTPPVVLRALSDGLAPGAVAAADVAGMDHGT